MKILLLTLRTFSATGGIEKVCRILGKALYEQSMQEQGTLQIGSMYDQQEDAGNNIYFPAEYFTGFGVNKARFIKKMVWLGRKKDLVILSHINLLVVGWLIKKINPSVKLVLLAHGIEIWFPLSRIKTKMLRQCDSIWCVSHFTLNKIVVTHGVQEHRCDILNNCLDPFLPLPSVVKKNKMLLEKYDFAQDDLILMTLTRISSKERYKGYDKVIEAVAGLKKKYPGIKYLIAGSYDAKEKKFVDKLISKLELTASVTMTGYIEDEELEDHFALSNMYVMPSRKEGFGIVFIEAMYYGLPVIAGNIDGSSDALLGGELGQLVNPDDVSDIAGAIDTVIQSRKEFIPPRRLLEDHFGYEAYKRKVEGAIATSK